MFSLLGIGRWAKNIQLAAVQCAKAPHYVEVRGEWQDLCYL